MAKPKLSKLVYPSFGFISVCRHSCGAGHCRVPLKTLNENEKMRKGFLSNFSKWLLLDKQYINSYKNYQWTARFLTEFWAEHK